MGSSPTSRFDVRRRRRRDEEDDVFARATVGPRHTTTEEKPVEDDVLRDGCPFVVVLLVLCKHVWIK